MAFRNPPIAGVTLVRPAIQSPNYVLGSAGWSINRDGSVEFNQGTFRGSVSIGNLTGQHAILANSATGDPIDVYNTANQLVFSIDQTGRLVSQSRVSTSNVVMNGGSIFFEDTAQNPQLPPQMQGSLSATQSTLQLLGGIPQSAAGGTQDPYIFLTGQTTTAGAWINVLQRGVQGAMLQTDGANTSGSNNQLVHLDIYTVTTDSGGTGIWNHNCPFTPTFGFLIGINGVGANFPYQWAWFANPFTSTTAKAAFKNNLGAAMASTTLGVMGVFFG